MVDFFKKYLLAFVGSLITLIVLIVFNKITVWWIFLLIVLVWLAVLTYLIFLRNTSKEDFRRSLPLLIITAISFLALILLIEAVWIKYIVSVLLIGVIFFLIFHSTKKSELSYLDKPVRRFVVMLWVMNLFCLSSFLYAINLFFQNIPFWVLSFLLSLLAACVSVNIWKNYFAIHTKIFLFWFILLVLISWEISWILHFLPFGYLVLGSLFTWVWYIINLLVRFHLTSQGIVWKKQIFFLVSNLVLYFTILFFFVRWI